MEPIGVQGNWWVRRERGFLRPRSPINAAVQSEGSRVVCSSHNNVSLVVLYLPHVEPCKKQAPAPASEGMRVYPRCRCALVPGNFRKIPSATQRYVQKATGAELPARAKQYSIRQPAHHEPCMSLVRTRAPMVRARWRSWELKAAALAFKNCGRRCELAGLAHHP